MDASGQRAGEDDYSMEVLTSFVNSIDEDTGWQHDFPVPGRKEDTPAQDVFPDVSNVLGLREEAMEIFLAEDRQMKKKGTKIVFCHDGCDTFKELSVVRFSI